MDSHSIAMKSIEELSQSAYNRFVKSWHQSASFGSVIQSYIQYRLSIDNSNNFILNEEANLGELEIKIVNALTSIFRESLLNSFRVNMELVDKALGLYSKDELWNNYSGRCCDFLDMSARTELFYQIYDPIKKIGVMSNPAFFSDFEEREKYEDALNLICGKIMQGIRSDMGHWIPMIDEGYGNTNDDNIQKYRNSIVVGDSKTIHEQDESRRIEISEIFAGGDVVIDVDNEAAKSSSIRITRVVSADGKVSIEIGNVSPKQFNEFIAVMEEFLQSKEARKMHFFKKIGTRKVIKEAKKIGGNSGIKSVVEYLADVSTIVVNFLNLFPGSWIIRLFK